MSNYFVSCYSGARNMGDEFILECLVNHIRKQDPQATIEVASINPDITEQLVSGVEAIEWAGFVPSKRTFKLFFELAKAIKKADIVIIGGGGLLQDVHTVATIPRYLITAALAKYYSKKVMYYSLGVGPIKSPILKKLVKDVSNQFVDTISVRDETSKNLLEALGVTTKVEVISDPVFLISDLVPMEKWKRTSIDRVGIAFRQFKTDERVEEELSRLIEGLPDKSIFLYPFDYKEDIKLMTRLKEKHPQISLVSDYQSNEDLLNSLSELDLMVSMRLHGVITCASYGIPSVAVSYDPKVDAFQKLMGMEDYLLDISVFNAKDCLSKIEEIEKNIVSIQKNLKQVVSEEKQKLDSVQFQFDSNKKVSKIKSIIMMLRMIYPQIRAKLF